MMKKITGIIFILIAVEIHAQQKWSFAIESGINTSWAVKTYESNADVVKLKPGIGTSVALLLQYHCSNNFYLETGIKYKLTTYRYTILNSVKGYNLSGRLLGPALLGYYKKDISEKLSLTISAGAIADLIGLDGGYTLSAGFPDTTLLGSSDFIYNKKSNCYLVGGLGLLKRKNETRKFELQLSYNHSLAYERKGDIIIYKSGVPIEEAKHTYYGSYISLQLRFYMGKKPTEKKPV